MGEVCAGERVFGKLGGRGKEVLEEGNDSGENAAGFGSIDREDILAGDDFEIYGADGFAQET